MFSMHAKDADKEPAAASVFVLVYQQLRQYLYFGTSQPDGSIEEDLSMSFSIDVSGSRDRTSSALSETFGGGARSSRFRPAGVAGAAGLGGGSCDRTSKSLSETFEGARSTCRCPSC